MSNPWQRFDETLNSQKIEEITAGDLVTTYVWSSEPWADWSKAIWQIRKIVQDSSVVWTVSTSIWFPNWDNRYGFVWDDRASYTYS